MKVKFTAFIPVLIFVFSLMALLVFAFDVSIQTMGIVLLIGFFAGLFHGLFKLFVVPPKWFLSIRFIFYGITFTGVISIASLSVVHEDDFQITWGLIFAWLLVGIGAGIYQLWRFKKMCKKTEFKKLAGEKILLDDYATCEKECSSYQGRLILTDKRLCFRSVVTQDSDFDCLLSKINPSIELCRTKGFPSGIEVGKGDAKFKVAFPKLWIKKVNL